MADEVRQAAVKELARRELMRRRITPRTDNPIGQAITGFVADIAKPTMAAIGAERERIDPFKQGESDRIVPFLPSTPAINKTYETALGLAEFVIGLPEMADQIANPKKYGQESVGEVAKGFVGSMLQSFGDLPVQVAYDAMTAPQMAAGDAPNIKADALAATGMVKGIFGDTKFSQAMQSGIGGALQRYEESGGAAPAQALMMLEPMAGGLRGKAPLSVNEQLAAIKKKTGTTASILDNISEIETIGKEGREQPQLFGKPVQPVVKAKVAEPAPISPEQSIVRDAAKQIAEESSVKKRDKLFVPETAVDVPIDPYARGISEELLHLGFEPDRIVKMTPEERTFFVSGGRQGSIPLAGKNAKRAILGAIGAGLIPAMFTINDDGDVEFRDSGEPILASAGMFGLLYPTKGNRMRRGKATVREAMKSGVRQHPKTLGIKLALDDAAIIKPSPMHSKTFNFGIETGLNKFERMGDAVKEAIYRPVVEADRRIVDGHRVIADGLTDVLKKNKISGVFAREKVSERIMLYAISKQAGGAEILADMKLKVPTLSAGELSTYAYMRGVYESLYTGIQKARKESGQLPMAKVENYFTWMQNFAELTERGDSFLNKSFEGLGDKYLPSDKTAFRFAKHRETREGVLKRNLELDAIKVFDNYVSSALRHIEYSPHLSRVQQAMLTVGKDGKTLAQRNPGAYSALVEYVNDAAGLRHTLPKPVEKTLTALNGNLVFAILSWSVQAATTQAFALIPAIREIGGARVLSNLHKGLLPEARKFAMEHSQTLPGREYESAVPKIKKGITGKTSFVKEAVGDAGLYVLKELDLSAAIIVWHAAFERAKSLGLEMKEAVNFADDTVTRTQGSAARRDLSPIQRHTLGKSLTMFQTFAINEWNNIAKIIGLDYGKKLTPQQKAQQIARYVASVTIANIVAEEMLGIDSPLPNPVGAFMDAQDKKGADAIDPFLAAGHEALSVIPMVGGAQQYGGSPFGAAVDLAKDVAEKVSGKPQAKSIFSIGGRILGVPGTRQIEKLHKEDKKKKRKIIVK